MKNKTPKQRHVPMRTCIGTGVKKPKNEMIRLVRAEDGTVVVDLKGKLKGRGANLDMSEEALELALKKKAIERALKLEKKLNEKQIEGLRQAFRAAIEEKAFRKGNTPVVIRIKKDELKKKISS